MLEVRTDDGRTLAVEEWAEPSGRPVVYLHGTPLSRLARHPDEEMFRRLGIRLITYDRPGFGESSPMRGRRIADAAADVAAIADALGLDRFRVFGVSGGGPHALACAALLPGRVERVAALACPAPIDADGLDWYAGLIEMNADEARAAAQGRDALEAHMKAEIAADLPSILPPIEQPILSRPEIRAMIGPAYAEAMRPGPDGAIDDTMALYGLPWGFDPAKITVPVYLWHGDLDTLVPAAHSRWLASRIPTATLRTDPGAGHAAHFDATPAMLDWLMSDSA
ncbi:alpha/beta fold hydrolase [Bailinhaonella thermotolerans]|uniref:Alpha/beta hydrolase n=1 Tax=Bailinhaonella thermotolerans TaxID=1070861 RepID=A0A3A3ZXC9_9ACTN|nr:alpha/beta hydrolase [Bailinhaonella thermotolerans]RJL19505.1 alpha/beta hydrolase [Bailinhaonella thermotolerans]